MESRISRMTQTTGSNKDGQDMHTGEESCSARLKAAHRNETPSKCRGMGTDCAEKTMALPIQSRQSTPCLRTSNSLVGRPNYETKTFICGNDGHAMKSSTDVAPLTATKAYTLGTNCTDRNPNITAEKGGRENEVTSKSGCLFSKSKIDTKEDKDEFPSKSNTPNKRHTKRGFACSIFLALLSHILLSLTPGHMRLLQDDNKFGALQLTFIPAVFLLLVSGTCMHISELVFARLFDVWLEYWF